MVQDYSTIENLDRFEATQYRLLITALLAIKGRGYFRGKRVIFYIDRLLKTGHMAHFIRLNQVYSEIS
jgi:hypothetical protein